MCTSHTVAVDVTAIDPGGVVDLRNCARWPGASARPTGPAPPNSTLAAASPTQQWPPRQVGVRAVADLDGQGPDRHRACVCPIRRVGALDYAALGVPMIARVRSRMLVIALSPEAARAAFAAAGRLLVSSRQACSVLMVRRATMRGPGWSPNSHPGAVPPRCQVQVTGPVTAIVTLSPGRAWAWARR